MAIFHPRGQACTYCGDLATQRDHVIPHSYLIAHSAHRKHRFRSEHWVVPACDECNRYLGDLLLFNVPDRARYLAGRLRVKWRATLNTPDWSEAEIAGLRGNFRRRMRAVIRLKRSYLQRLAYIDLVAAQDDDYLLP